MANEPQDPIVPDDHGTDPVIPGLEVETSRRRRRPLFRHRRVPVRMIVPNFVTVLGLCAGLTSIRMGIEGRYDLALAAIVFAACLDGLDGRIARYLKASSRFGAELDSLADFVNFGVAPAFLIYNFGLSYFKNAGWICVLLFALASALRLARFNAALDDDKPKWQANYFTGIPTPAAAIVVLLPVYLEQIGFEGLKTPWALRLQMLYTLFVAFMMISNIPTFSGKLMGERIGRDWVLPAIFVAVGVVSMLFSYPYETLTFASIFYLASVPVSWKRFQEKSIEEAQSASLLPVQEIGLKASVAMPETTEAEATGTKQTTSGRILAWRQNEPPR